jgi:D-beta-D-heptose 7-phosphate kinase/D-beta-D-heptose 1-phosphate adenosyltransferase
MKVLIIGDSCVDIYIYGNCTRLCPEGPVPVLLESSRKKFPGMSGNVYNNMRCFFTEKELDLVTNNFELIEKVRFIDEKTNHILLRLDTNDKCDRISDDIIDKIPNNYDAVLVSDYCKGFLSGEDIIKLAKKGKMAFLDSKRKLTQEIVSSFDFIKLNQYEYENNKELVELSLEKFVITLGAKGVSWNRTLFPPLKEVKTSDVSGAGDTFFAAFASPIIKNLGIDIAFAQNCCIEAIQKNGTCVYGNGMG